MNLTPPFVSTSISSEILPPLGLEVWISCVRRRGTKCVLTVVLRSRPTNYSQPISCGALFPCGISDARMCVLPIHCSWNGIIAELLSSVFTCAARDMRTPQRVALRGIAEYQARYIFPSTFATSLFEFEGTRTATLLLRFFSSAIFISDISSSSHSSASRTFQLDHCAELVIPPFPRNQAVST